MQNPRPALAVDPLPSFTISDLNPKSDDYGIKVTDRLLSLAAEHCASDLHLDSLADGCIVRIRTKGKLSLVAEIPAGQNSQVIARIKSLAGLLTYRCDVPQEGRIALASGSDARVCTLPTLYGERLVVRFSVSQTEQWQLDDLGLPTDVLERLTQSLDAATGVVLITGPAGSGKTTTAYAALQKLSQAAAADRRCLISLEDPIEQVIGGVAQSQIQPSVGFDWSSGLKAMLRQDPEVMLIGEIRDEATAKIVFQAATTGQLVVSTMHARSAADAVGRLLEMDIPKHQILASLLLLLNQRLIRTNIGSGRDRILLVEHLPKLQSELRDAILSDEGAEQIEKVAISQGMKPMWTMARECLERGEIDDKSFRRQFQSS